MPTINTTTRVISLLTTDTKPSIEFSLSASKGNVVGCFVRINNENDLATISDFWIEDRLNKKYVDPMDVREFKRNDGSGFWGSFLPINIPSGEEITLKMNTKTAPSKNVDVQVVLVHQEIERC